MKLLFLFTILSFVNGCATSKSTVAIPEQSIYFDVEPTPKTRIETYHVQTEKFPPILQSEFDQALTGLAGKCWYWAVPSYKETVAVNGPDYCLKFVKYKKMSLLKPYKREPTDKKMLLTSLDQADSIQVQSFVWDGAKLQRVRNSDSRLQSNGDQRNRFANFLILWALK